MEAEVDVEAEDETEVEDKSESEDEDENEDESEDEDEDVDEFLEQAIEMVVQDGQASASYIQRKFKVGYSRAARIIDQLEEIDVQHGQAEPRLAAQADLAFGHWHSTFSQSLYQMRKRDGLPTLMVWFLYVDVTCFPSARAYLQQQGRGGEVATPDKCVIQPDLKIDLLPEEM